MFTPFPLKVTETKGSKGQLTLRPNLGLKIAGKKHDNVNTRVYKTHVQSFSDSLIPFFYYSFSCTQTFSRYVSGNTLLIITLPLWLLFRQKFGYYLKQAIIAACKCIVLKIYLLFLKPQTISLFPPVLP